MATGDTIHPHLSTYVLGKYAAEMMDKINKKRQTQLQYCRLALSRTLRAGGGAPVAAGGARAAPP